MTCSKCTYCHKNEKKKTENDMGDEKVYLKSRYRVWWLSEVVFGHELLKIMSRLDLSWVERAYRLSQITTRIVDVVLFICI
jgi:hypothetical protein